MPSKEHDVEVEEGPAADRPREKHRRPRSERKPDRDRDGERDKDKDRDRDRDRDKDRDRERDPDREKDRERRHRHSRSSRHKHGDGSEVSRSSAKRHRSKREGHGDESREHHERDRAASTSNLTATASRSSLATKRVSMPYPSFSKAHSKEAVISRDDLVSRKDDPLTPEPTNTDLDGEGARRSKSVEIPRRSSTTKTSRPPSPPETDVSADKRAAQEESKEDAQDAPRSKSRASTTSGPGSPKIDDGSKVSNKSRSSSQATFVKTPMHKPHDKVRSSSRASSLSRESLKRSASNRSARPRSEIPEAESSPSSVQDSSPRTPTQGSRISPHLYYDPRPESTLTPGVDEDPHSKTATPASTAGFGDAPPPPPPPPPPQVDIHDIPRVDYLLQNGGLQHTVPRNFSAVIPRQNGTRPSNPPLVGSETLFAPFFNLFEQYQTVLDKAGSLAVATGHRSVARRLLDRLENVFSRDLPAHGCSCVCCEQSEEKREGLTWGDCLEWVSGRIELPQWPPFDLAEMSTKAAEISAEEPRRPDSPINMDPDIAEEFREHYLRQSKKVRSAVDKWLNNTGDTPVPPPQDVDDETLTFAVLTSLEPEDRPYFSALLTGSKELKPSNRAPTPSIRQRNDFIIKSGLALQRLYRLPQAPRDAESACYLIKNRHTHGILVALANINNSEWEILTSGRFDGFLWSGADESRGATPATDYGGSRAPSSFSHRGPSAMGSRTTTPFTPFSRGATPASFVSLSSNTTSGRHAVSNDEEMEMAAIAEIEREIYTGMESLEDAFEKLHLRAEVIRNALRERGAGLMQNLQSRRRIDVYPMPGSGNSINSNYERPGWADEDTGAAGSDSEWGGLDDFDIMPDDSASNISSSRHRRPKRRTERRTPALIEEDEEER